MQNIRAAFIAVSAFAALALVTLLTASFAVALCGIVAILSLGRALSQRLKPAELRGSARATRQAREPRIWNDGRGTIIDL